MVIAASSAAHDGWGAIVANVSDPVDEGEEMLDDSRCVI